MDELDLFWERYFGVPASAFERRLLAQIMSTIEPGDPVFVVAAMLARQLYISIGEKEKAVLRFGPALSRQMENLEGTAGKISSDLAAILNDVRQLEQSLAMLNARLVDNERAIPQMVAKRAAAMVDADYRKILPWVFGLCLAFIAGVMAVTIFTP